MKISKDKVSILLVDDQDGRLLSYEAILDDLEQNLVRAKSGKDALQLLMKDDFAVILLDVNMPVMDGFETAKLIRQHPRYEATPIIFVTAIHDTDFDRRKGYELGAVDYIHIPIIPEILRSKVAVLVELYQKRRDLKKLNKTLEEANEELGRANNALLTEKSQELRNLNQALARTNEELLQTNRALKAEIIERNRAEQALKYADRRKDEFLAMLAHELRNPLAPIRNALEILRIDPDPDGQRQAQSVIERQVQQMVRLVDDLLDVSRITQGRIELRREWLDLRTIIQSALEATRPIIDAARQRIDIAVPDEPLLVDGDSARLSQVVSNILNNASKFTEPGGRIELGAGRDGEDLVVTVVDEGRGIPPNFLPRIFDMFTQVDRSLERSQGGLGIGLALARTIVQMHGGTIEAESEGVGKGTKLTVRLPAARQEREERTEKPERELAAAAARPKPGPRRRILVADDNLDSAESMSLMLELLGHEVYRAGDGQEALERASAVRPEVVLLDIGMPRMNGYVAARRIRQTCGDDVVLIAVTGWGQPEDRKRALEAGFNAHLTKPVEPAELQRLIERPRSDPS